MAKPDSSQFKRTDSSSCGKCGYYGIGTYYSRREIGRECARCSHRWIQVVSPRAIR